MRLSAILRLALASTLLAGGFAIPAALAQSYPSAVAPYSAKASAREVLRAPEASASAIRIELEALDPKAVEDVRQANAKADRKRLQIGIGRALDTKPGWRSTALEWKVAAGCGAVAHWEVRSPEARALRVGLLVSRLAPGTEIRFLADGDGTVYGPFTASDVPPEGPLYWSPVLEGDTATVEVFVPNMSATSEVALGLAQVSHFIASPSNPMLESLLKDAGPCEVDLICRSATDAALASTGRAVARMTFTDGSGSGTFLCTGTLLNATDGALTPYFYSAAHCISTQASASTLTTHWFYDRTGCNTGGTSPSYVQVGGGAALLHAAPGTTDVLLVRMNSSPPGGAVFAGWNAATLATGTAMTAVHHPAGDLKKVSLGTMGGFGATSLASGSFLQINWNSTATGVTEGGSSGSGVFSFTGAEYQFRGGLLGGPSSCTAGPADLFDFYSRFDQAYSLLAHYLSPSTAGCSYTLSPASQSVSAAGAASSFGITTGGGCTWAALSNDTWITTNSGGSGSGTVNFTVAANPTASARTGTISVGGRTFTVTQAGQALATGTNILNNPGFESGRVSWVESASGGLAIITNEPGNTHSGSWDAWLGGYHNAIDIVYQDVAIPSSATQVTLQYWFDIFTEESTGGPIFDQMTVEVVNPVSGQVMATVASYSNAAPTRTGVAPLWTLSPAFDLTGFRGQTIRLRFRATTDGSLLTNFRVDDVALLTSGGGGDNYTALWYNPSESGWGVNVNHQGDILFATLFTHDASGTPMWLVLAAGVRQGSGTTYSGTLYRTVGTPFNVVPFVPQQSADVTPVGSMTFTFSSASTASLTYSVNGITVVKAIQKQDLGGRFAFCQAVTGSRAGATNYQDLWFNSSESGWGVNLTHAGDIVFATLFVYDGNRNPFWYVLASGTRQSDGSYFGTLYRTTGSPFNAQPYIPQQASNVVAVGTMRFRPSNGETGTLEYTVNGVSVTKSITRQVFSSPMPQCTS